MSTQRLRCGYSDVSLGSCSAWWNTVSPRSAQSTPDRVPSVAHVGTHSTHSSDAFLRNIRLGYSHARTRTHALARTHTHTVLDGHCMARSFLPVVPVVPRLAPMCTGGLQGHCDTPPRCAADRFCSSKVRWARPPLPVRVECRRAHVQSTSRRGIHAACITPLQVHTPSGATTARLWRTPTDSSRGPTDALMQHARMHELPVASEHAAKPQRRRRRGRSKHAPRQPYSGNNPSLRLQAAEACRMSSGRARWR